MLVESGKVVTAELEVLTTYYLQRTTHYLHLLRTPYKPLLLFTIRLPLLTSCSFLVPACGVLLTTYCALYSLLPTYEVLPPAPLSTAHHLPSTSYCLLLRTYCLRLNTYCPPATDYL